LGVSATVSAGALSASGQLAETPLRSLHDVVAISHQDAARELPAVFEATVTYFRSYEKTLFVQDGEDAMYVGATTSLPLVPATASRSVATPATASGPLSSPVTSASSVTKTRHSRTGLLCRDDSLGFRLPLRHGSWARHLR